MARDRPELRRITYSPKVFIPLTMLCRDRCGYCTFAQSPAHLPAPYLSIDEVLDVARAGAEAGCHEALFTLGESPEDRYPVARAWLNAHGFASTVEYLAHAAQRVLAETGLLHPLAQSGHERVGLARVGVTSDLEPGLLALVPPQQDPAGRRVHDHGRARHVQRRRPAPGVIPGQQFPSAGEVGGLLARLGPMGRESSEESRRDRHDASLAARRSTR